MSKEEYLNQLHKYLRKLPRQDYEDAMEYFTEYFQETDEEGAEELMKELESKDPKAEVIFFDSYGDDYQIQAVGVDYDGKVFLQEMREL